MTFFEKIIRTNRKKFFDITTNYENFQKILPQYFPSVRIISVRGNISVVEEHLRINGRELIMMVKHVIDEPMLHEIFVIGGDAKGTHISQRYECVPHGTKVLLEVDWKLKGTMKLANFFYKNKMENAYSKIIDELIVIAEN